MWLRSELDYSNMLHNHIGGSEDRRVGRTRVFTRLSDVGVQEGTIIKHMWEEEWGWI